MGRILESFNESDLQNMKTFKLVLSNGNFEIKGDAIIKVASLFNWFNKLDIKIEDTIKQNKLNSMSKGSSVKAIK